MSVKDFAKWIVKSGVLDIYVAAVFFATTIFFVLNASSYTPLEMMFWIVCATIVFKGLANIMLSILIALVKLDNKQHKIEFQNQENILENLVKELSLKEAAIQSAKTNAEKSK